MSEIELYMDGLNVAYLQIKWAEGGGRCGEFLSGAVHFTRGELQDELFFLHQIWFIKGEL